MPTDYDRIREANIHEYGAGTRHLAFLGTLYPDRTHFLFELLQNAEDAGARSLRFHLRRDRLELWHDGRPFTESDVRGLCGVGEGTKADDLTQIGRFGIGFKSVYAYTTTPEIHSGEEHFGIEHFVRPFAVPLRHLGPAWTTLFTFPFDRPDMKPEQVFDEISRGLTALSARTLLFLRRIEEVEWIIEDGTKGCYLRDEQPVTGGRRITTITQRDNTMIEEQHWIVFTRQIRLPTTDRFTSVELAFQMGQGEKGELASVTAMKSSPLVAFFPTEKETRLGFLIQGPYRTTPARDNVPIDDAWNRQLIEETAILVVDSLNHLKGMGLLTVSVLEAMPIRPSDFPVGSMFFPIYRRVRTALQEQPLLPGHARDCDFIRAEDAKLARGTDLTGLFYPQQLGPLFGRERLYWLSTEISENRTPELFRYIAGFAGRLPGDGTAIAPLIKEVLVTPETVARRITGKFMAKRVDVWVANFYIFLGKQPAVWDTLKEKPFIRLEDGSHVVPFQPTGQPNAYLPLSEASDFPTVKREIAFIPQARKFMLDFGLTEPSILSEVLHIVLPKYAADEVAVDDDEHREDLDKIRRALREANQEDRASLVEQLQATHFILAIDTDGVQWYVAPVEAYLSTPELRTYFDGNPAVYFIDDAYDDEQRELFREVGASPEVRITRREVTYGTTVVISDYGYHKRGLNGFDPECQIDGLEFALGTITVAKAAYIWNHLLMPNIHLISGIVESDSWKTYKSPNYSRSFQCSTMGLLVRANAWLPDSEGAFACPDDMTLNDLPDNFARSEALAAALGMGAPVSNADADAAAEEAAAAEKLGLSLDIIQLIRERPELVERARMMFEDERARDQRREAAMAAAGPRSYLRELSAAFDKPGKHASLRADVPIGAVPNPALRRERTSEEIEGAIRAEPTPEQRFRRVESRVWEAKDNTVRIFLREQYGGRCQICGETFEKRDGEPYFEGLYLVSQTHARWSGRSGNVICLCPTCCAKFLHGPVEADSIIDQIDAIHLHGEGGPGHPSLRIRLCDEDIAIRFTEAHMLDLQEIVRRAQGEEAAN